MSEINYGWLETFDGQFIPWGDVKRISVEEISVQWVDGDFWAPIFGGITLPNARQVIAHGFDLYGEARWCLGLYDDERTALEVARNIIGVKELASERQK